MGEELVPTMSLSPAVTLDAYGVHTTVERLEPVKDIAARILVARIRKEWRFRKSGQQYITLRLTNNELDLVRQAGSNISPQLVSYKYLAVYYHALSGQRIKVRTTDRPPRKRSFKTPNHGRRRFNRVKLFRINQPKETASVATRTRSKKKNVKASDESEDDDELEGLEELEELEAEEPEDDDEEEDEDEEDEEPAPKKRRRSSSKKSAAKKSSGRKKSKPVVEEDDEEEDEDDDEEEEAPPKKTRSRKASAKKSSGKKKSAGTKTPGASTKELTGGVGSAELAAAASELAEVEITGRDVRVYLRKNEIPKNEEHGRYVWPSEKNKAFVKLAKAIAAEYEDEE